MLLGYARTSTADQIAGIEAQERDLTNAGVEKLFTEHVSGATADRPELLRALEYARDEDTLVVTKLDRLARSTQHLLEIVGYLEKKEVGLRILDFGGGEVDTKSPQGKLTLTMFAAFAEFERSLMLERQREGIEKARRQGKYKGRKPLPADTVTQVKSLREDGMGCSDIAKTAGISRASVYRIIGPVA